MKKGMWRGFALAVGLSLTSMVVPAQEAITECDGDYFAYEEFREDEDFLESAEEPDGIEESIIEEEAIEDNASVDPGEVIESADGADVTFEEEEEPLAASEMVTVTWNAGEGQFSDPQYDPTTGEESYKFYKTEQERGSFLTYIPYEGYLVPPDGKMFKGWSLNGVIVDFGWQYDENTGDGHYDYVVNGNVTFTAVYVDYYTVTFDAGQGQFEYPDYDPLSETSNYKTKQIKVEKGGHLTTAYDSYSLIAPTGRAFKGWTADGSDEIIDFNAEGMYHYDEETGTGYYTYVIDRNITFTAVYVQALSVTVDAGEGFVEYWDSEKQEYVDTHKYVDSVAEGAEYYLSASECTRNGYEAIGWIDEAGNTYDWRFKGIITGNKTFTAVWVETVTVTVDPNGGFWDDENEYDDEPKSLTYRKNEKLWGDDFYVENADDRLVLAGWSLTRNGDVWLGIDEYVKITENVTLYASWTSGVTVTLKGNGGKTWDGNDVIKRKGPAGSMFGLWEDSFEKDGYIISSWTGSDGKTYEADEEYQFSSNITLTANWVEAVTITLLGNGGVDDDDESVATRKCAGGGFVYLGGRVFKKEDEAISGWVDERGNTYDINEAYAFDKDTTLTAVWGEAVTITFNGNGGITDRYDLETVVVIKWAKGKQVDYEPYFEYPDLSKSLAGWALSPNATSTINVYDYVANEDTTFFAVWTEGHVHSWSSGIIKAVTCTTDGVRKYTCECGQSYTEPIAALDHSWGAWVVTTPATTAAAGVETRTCSRCSAKETRAIAKLQEQTQATTTSASTPAPTTVAKQTQPLTVKAKKPSIKASKLKKKNQTIAAKKAITVSGAQGTLSYKKLSGNKKITINAKNGKITLKKGLKKGTYKVKIQVSATGNDSYEAGSKAVTVKITVK